MDQYAQETAESLFHRLDKRLQPTVIFLGVSIGDTPTRQPVWVEPHIGGYETDRFSELKSEVRKLRAKGLIEKVPGRQYPDVHKDPLTQKIARQHDLADHIRHKVGEIISVIDREQRTVSYCYVPMFVEPYVVFIILQLNSDIVGCYYSLNKDRHNPLSPVTLHAESLIEAAVGVFQDWCEIGWRTPRFEREERPADPDQLIRDAGRLLMEGIYVEGDGPSEDLYRAFNSISSLTYEGAGCTGKVLLVSSKNKDIDAIMRLNNPVPLSRYRSVRKLLELTKEGMSLLSDARNIFGLGKETDVFSPVAKELFSARFITHHTWDLCHAGNPMMRVKYGQPSLPQRLIEEEEFKKVLKMVFRKVDIVNENMIWSIVLAATRQKRGTMVIISDTAEKEALRLSREGIAINPIRLNPEIALAVTTIDGAVLLGTDCTCFAIGVIVDGLTTEKGDPSRGARFNSAVRYVRTATDQLKQKCLAVVVSEDGTVDVVT